MNLKSIHQLVSFKSLLQFLIGFSLAVQLIVILYNHLSGYHLLSGFGYFLFRVGRGVTFTLVAALVLAYADLYFIRFLNQIALWGRATLKRILIQLVFSVSVALVVSVAFTSFANFISPYSEELKGVYISNALIFSVVNVFMVSILEGWIFFTQHKRVEQMAKNLEKELSQIKFEVLKSQINPHFMFNSLNVLSGLVNTDTGKAQQFIDEFSQVYRYVLETIEQPVASLEKELDFMRSYLFLQQIRYGDSLRYTIHVPATLLKFFLPPLSLQVVLENAIKHNVINASNPLTIDIYSAGNYLIVKNNLQPKQSMGQSTGLGLKNLTKRYAIIGTEQPVFVMQAACYTAKLPLIDGE
jgi:sensor histidine kinase YesM